MEIHEKDHDLLCTFSCGLEADTMTATDCTAYLFLINFSEPAIQRREEIRSFKSSYGQLTNTVSVFARNQGERLLLVTKYGGAPFYEERCSRFDIHGSRLRCHLASSAAEVAFFSDTFPPVPVKASGHFVKSLDGSGREGLLKVSISDPRIVPLPLQPAIGQYIHPSLGRRASITQSLNENIAPGVLFVHVYVMGQNPSTRQETVTTASGKFKVPELLAVSLRSMYPGEVAYPYHMVELLTYVELERTNQIEGCDTAYLEGLEQMEVKLILDVIIVGIDILKKEVLSEMYRIVGSKLDEFGRQTLQESAEDLGFMVNNEV